MTMLKKAPRVAEIDCVPVNPLTFRKAFNERGLTFRQVSMSMGCGENYLNKRIETNQSIPRYVMEYLEKTYGINTETVSRNDEPAKKGPISYPKRFPVDDLKLRKAIADKGFTLSEVSKAMGFAQNYLSICSNTVGTMPEVAAFALERVTGIPPSAYIKQAEPEEKPAAAAQKEEKPAPVTEETLARFAERLSEMIEKAAYEGVTRALCDVKGEVKMKPRGRPKGPKNDK